MSTKQMLFSGFGGQGILFSGKFIAYKGLMEDKQVSWLPSYGPEMRGGTASCGVIVSDEPVGSPIVSNADMMAEKTLIEQLSTDKPDFGFITEESERIEPKNGCTYSWIIDPIDGTTNFLHALPCFSISVAVMEGDEVLAGVSFNPVTNEMYYAEKGRGSFLMTPTGNVRLRVSGRNDLSCSLIGSNGYNSTRNRQVIDKVITKVASVRYNGSTTMALASVAAGQYDAYIATRFKLWDIAVGYLLIKEAGGYISNFKGERDLMDIVNAQEMITCNMPLKETFLELINS